MVKRLYRYISVLLCSSVVCLSGCSGSTAPSGAESASSATSGSEASSQAASESSEAPGASSTSGETIKIGVIEPLSGTDALNGQTMKAAYQYAVDKVNAAGGIEKFGGAKLEIVWGDHQSKQDVAMSEVERLINSEGVQVLAGAELSGATMAATQVAERMQVPFVVDVPAAAAITERGFQYTFRSNISAVEYGSTFVDFVNYTREKYGLEVNTAALFYEDTEIGSSVMDAARALLPDNNLELVFDQAHLSGIQDASTHATKIRSANPDVLLMNDAGPDSIIVTKGLAAVGVKPKMIITADGGYELPYWHEKVGDLADGWIEMIQWNSDLPGMAELSADYNAATEDQLNGHSALAIQVVYIIKEALENAESTEPQAIRDSLANLVIEEGSESLIMPWDKVDFDENGQNTGAINIVVQWQGDSLVTVYPEKVAVAEPKVPADYFV